MPKWLEGTLVIGGVAIATTVTWTLLIGEVQRLTKPLPCAPIGGVRLPDGTWKCNDVAKISR